MNRDITPLLKAWDYRPGEVTVRRIKGRDGEERIQLRIDLGLLQMNATGRPDGKRPLGHESLLEYFRAQLDQHQAKHGKEHDLFQLSSEDCARLQQEAIQYHHRYICFFQLGDYESVVRDTERNLQAFDFADEHAASDELAWSLQQFRPQTLMMRARALGTMAIEARNHSTAIRIVQDTLGTMREFYAGWQETDQLETSGEILSLEQWLEELQTQRPLTEKEQLEKTLHDAVAREDYESAARVRDAIRNLGHRS